MVLFAFGFWYAFSSTEYSSAAKPYEKPLPWWRAILHALNPSDLLFGIAKIFPLCGEVHRSGEWKNWSTAQRQKPGEALTKIKNLKNLRKQPRGQTEGPYGYGQFDGSTEALTKPVGSHRGRAESEATISDVELYPMTNMSGQELYRPPSTTPPDQTSSHLMAQPYLADSRTASPGHWNGQSYDRTPSPSVRVVEEPSHGRDAD